MLWKARTGSGRIRDKSVGWCAVLVGPDEVVQKVLSDLVHVHEEANCGGVNGCYETPCSRFQQDHTSAKDRPLVNSHIRDWSQCSYLIFNDVFRTIHPIISEFIKDVQFVAGMIGVQEMIALFYSACKCILI